MINESKSLILTAALAVVSLIISGYSTYSHNDKEISTKVGVLESEKDNIKNSLEHLTDSFTKFDDKLERMDDRTERGFQALRDQINSVAAQQRREGWTYVPPKSPPAAAKSSSK